MLSRTAWFLLGALVVIYSVTLALDLTPLVRGPEEWRWARFSSTQWDRAVPVAIALAAVAAWTAWIDRRVAQSARPQRWIAAGVGALMLAAPIVQLLALRAERLNPFEALFDRAVDVAANGYFTVGHQIGDVGAFLRSYPALMPTLPIHPQVHPPGIPLIYWLAGSAFEAAPSLARPISLWFRRMECNDINLMLLSDARLASGLAGMLIPTLANMLTLACIYKLARGRFGVRAGLVAVALWVAVPSAVLFGANWSLVYPLFACLIWMATDDGLARRRLLPFFLAGLLTSLATFMELGAIALGLFLVLYILARYVVERRNPLRDWRFLGGALLATLAGLATIWLIYQAAFGVSVGQIVATMYPIHVGYEFDRLTWLINHPYEYVVFLGLPLAGLFALASVSAMRSARGARVDALSLSFGIGLVILSLIDPARDETPRTWMLLMPFAVVVVSQLLADAATWRTRYAATWALLAVQVCVMVAVLRVVETGLYGLPPRSTIAAMPTNATSVQAEFGGFARLDAAAVQRIDDNHIAIDLYWRSTGQADHPYVVFNHIVAASGQIAAQRDDRPQQGQLLMTCWQPGEMYADRHVVDWSPPSSLADYALQVGLYNAVSGSRVLIESADGSQADHVTLPLGEIESGDSH